jgi:hypothetical protein
MKALDTVIPGANILRTLGALVHVPHSEIEPFLKSEIAK